MNLLDVFLIIIGALSLITFLLYAIDKYKAQSGLWRIPEKVLLSFSFLGGSIGGLVGMFACRHKTKHGYFYIVNILGLVWQILLAYYLFTHPIIL